MSLSLEIKSEICILYESVPNFKGYSTLNCAIKVFIANGVAVIFIVRFPESEHGLLNTNHFRRIQVCFDPESI